MSENTHYAPPVPVSFELTAARNGWIGLTMTAGRQSYGIACSDVFDPFRELVDWAWLIAAGMHGCVEIDEEGHLSQIWLSREPGSDTGRLRVIEPDPKGGVRATHIDATVDPIQVARAFHETFSRYVADYDGSQWGHIGDRTGSTHRVLADIELIRLEAALRSPPYRA